MPVDEDRRRGAGRGTLAGMASRSEDPAALDTAQLFTRAQARAVGISNRRLRGPRFRAVLADVFVASHVPVTSREVVEAALLLHPAGARASHHSAAQLYDVPVPRDSRAHVSVEDPGDRRWRPGVVPHLSPPGITAWRRHGLPLSPPERLFVEMAAVLDLVDLVVLGDALVKRVGWTADELRRRLERCTTYWSGKARWAAGFVRDGVDSPMETRLRLLLVLAGLPEPEVDHHLVDADGVLLRRLDLAYRVARIAVEYDGRHHVERIESWYDDVEREAELREDRGWLLLKVVSRGIWDEPTRTVERVAGALRSRGVAVGPLSDDYLAHFPGRRAASA